MGYCDVAVRGSERYRRCALELDIAIFVLCGLTSAARQMGVLKSPAGNRRGFCCLGCAGRDQYFCSGAYFSCSASSRSRSDSMRLWRDFYVARTCTMTTSTGHGFVCLHFNSRMSTDLCICSVYSKECDKPCPIKMGTGRESCAPKLTLGMKLSCMHSHGGSSCYIC